MNNIRVAVGAMLLAAVTVGATTPAEAQWRRDAHQEWHDHDDWRRHGGYPGRGLLGASLIGVATGALIAGVPPVYGYAPPPYYYGPIYAPAAPVCTVRLRWDPYLVRYVRVEHCYR